MFYLKSSLIVVSFNDFLFFKLKLKPITAYSEEIPKIIKFSLLDQSLENIKVSVLPFLSNLLTFRKSKYEDYLHDILYKSNSDNLSVLSKIIRLVSKKITKYTFSVNPEVSLAKYKLYRKNMFFLKKSAKLNLYIPKRFFYKPSDYSYYLKLRRYSNRRKPFYQVDYKYDCRPFLYSYSMAELITARPNYLIRIRETIGGLVRYVTFIENSKICVFELLDYEFMYKYFSLISIKKLTLLFLEFVRIRRAGLNMTSVMFNSINLVECRNFYGYFFSKFFIFKVRVALSLLMVSRVLVKPKKKQKNSVSYTIANCLDYFNFLKFKKLKKYSKLSQLIIKTAINNKDISSLLNLLKADYAASNLSIKLGIVSSMNRLSLDNLKYFMLENRFFESSYNSLITNSNINNVIFFNTNFFFYKKKKYVNFYKKLYVSYDSSSYSNSLIDTAVLFDYHHFFMSNPSLFKFNYISLNTNLVSFFIINRNYLKKIDTQTNNKFGHNTIIRKFTTNNKKYLNLHKI